MRGRMSRAMLFKGLGAVGLGALVIGAAIGATDARVQSTPTPTQEAFVATADTSTPVAGTPAGGKSSAGTPLALPSPDATPITTEQAIVTPDSGTAQTPGITTTSEPSILVTEEVIQTPATTQVEGT